MDMFESLSRDLGYIYPYLIMYLTVQPYDRLDKCIQFFRVIIKLCIQFVMQCYFLCKNVSACFHSFK